MTDGCQVHSPYSAHSAAAEWFVFPRRHVTGTGLMRTFCKMAEIESNRTRKTMALTPIRRVVTGNDERGKSKVVWDEPSPGAHRRRSSQGHTDFWVWRETPPPLDGTEDAGRGTTSFPVRSGGHLRVVHWLAKTGESPAEALQGAATARPHLGPRRRQSLQPLVHAQDPIGRLRHPAFG
jgi:hypothetical protein